MSEDSLQYDLLISVATLKFCDHASLAESQILFIGIESGNKIDCTHMCTNIN